MEKSVWEGYENIIPSFILDKLSFLESEIGNDPDQTGKKYAIFDLDNTLLYGDIGDALFARLKNLEKNTSLQTNGSVTAFTWKMYRELIERGNKTEAYKNLVTCMEGIPLSVIENLTKEIMNSDFRYIEHNGEKIPIPEINEVMKKFVELLKVLDYKVFIISASNIYSVRFIAGEFFGIPSKQAFGIETKLIFNENKEKVLTGSIIKPVPIGNGKADLYRLKTEGWPPLVTAGDSEIDIPMMELTDKRGLSIWVGDDEERYRNIKGLMKNKKNLIYFDRKKNYSRGSN